ncbi:trypsin-like peptidase domain-containing protein [Haloferula rosea]|uniref:Trypsin-like peptidase domain-containing protein n=1 Tax=Haloferula rosea TaxID=490093 RepID=A0A934VAU0_9BACT|nr:trypsin-like peptidase domain-containing protein [Haloferula rosea]MBK1826683.1 trypsin-like peptidase domain-containing protein [Haloferula rosea]
MNQGFRRLLSLVVVFFIAFAVVFLIRNGTDGVRRLFKAGEDGSGFRPEAFTLPERPPLELGEVELLTRLNEECALLTAAVVPSVVSIDTSGVRSQLLFDGYGRQLVRPVPTQGQGSGVIVTHEGHLVTNHHVVKGQQQIQVTLHDGRAYTASLIGDDPLLDVAVLKIDAEGEFQPLKFGDSDQVRRGQMVFAIGNPFGLGETVTQGIISALERSLSDTQRDLFQTDAAINPGNSGGPLVNLQGEIIGINSAIYRPDGMTSGFQGVGFSIPSNDVKEVLYSILERGRPIRGYLGVRMLDLNPRINQMLDYDGTGAVIAGVGEGSPAELAGLRPKDVVVSFGGKKISNMAEMFNRVQGSRVGETVEIEIWRDGEAMTLQATIAEAVAEVAAPEPKQEPVRDPKEILAAVGVFATEVSGPGEGVVVRAVTPGSLAADRLEVGDRIVSVNRTPVTNVEAFNLQLAASAAAQVTALELLRDGRPVRVLIPPVPRQQGSADATSRRKR